MLFRFWNRFLFRSIDVRQYAFLRIGLGFLISLYMIGMLPLFADHFGPRGWLGAMRDLDLYHSGAWSLLFLTHSQTQAWAFFWITLFASAALTLGWLTRISGCIALIGLISLWNRNPLLMDGDDAILRVMLFYLLWSPCGNAFSIDARLHHRRQQAEIWPLRMIQIQLALVYLFSGWVKFHSPEWMNGTILQTVLIHPEYSRWNFNSLMNQPVFLKTLCLTSAFIMGWEILFPVLIVFRRTRVAAVATGLMFHGGLLVFMHLRLFSVIMLVLYIAWIPIHCFRGKDADNL
ncbi:MAG: HTTM domain-containing protein [Methylococcaceae bacterium]|nr:HTTM domain-containing protein [Methylococcaceae bacterium]